MNPQHYSLKAMIAVIGLIVGLGAIWFFPSPSSTYRAIVSSWFLFTMVCTLLSFALEDWYRTVENPRSRFGQFVKHSGMLSLAFSAFFLINLAVLLSLTIMATHG